MLVVIRERWQGENMHKRYVSLWFRTLLADRFARKEPLLKGLAYVFVETERGKKLIRACSAKAIAIGIREGMTLADALIFIAELRVFDYEEAVIGQLLNSIGEWCIRYSPAVSIDYPDGLILDVSGCTHLRGGEQNYLHDLTSRLRTIGYDVQGAMADTIGCAWAIARYGTADLIVKSGGQYDALLPLPATALRLSAMQVDKLKALGLHQISAFIDMPKAMLRRRFGKDMVLRILQATGEEHEFLKPLSEPFQYQERLECADPVRTRESIEYALHLMLDKLCSSLYHDGMGLRKAIFSYFLTDGTNENITIGTSAVSCKAKHIFSLFIPLIDMVKPGSGIELFVLEAPVVEILTQEQHRLWGAEVQENKRQILELLDRIEGKIGAGNINLYIPSAHHWPERNLEAVKDLNIKSDDRWHLLGPRPMQLLSLPEPIQASAITPDYPPFLFIYKGKKHEIAKADGPERIEREWWQDQGEHRDYYIVEDKEGKRYWIFRSGHYEAGKAQHWYLHGFFA